MWFFATPPALLLVVVVQMMRLGSMRSLFFDNDFAFLGGGGKFFWVALNSINLFCVMDHHVVE